MVSWKKNSQKINSISECCCCVFWPAFECLGTCKLAEIKCWWFERRWSQLQDSWEHHDLDARWLVVVMGQSHIGPWERTIFKSSVHTGQGKRERMNAKVEESWPSCEPDYKSEMRWHKQQDVVQVRNLIKWSTPLPMITTVQTQHIRAWEMEWKIPRDKKSRTPIKKIVAMLIVTTILFSS